MRKYRIGDVVTAYGIETIVTRRSTIGGLIYYWAVVDGKDVNFSGFTQAVTLKRTPPSRHKALSVTSDVCSVCGIQLSGRKGKKTCSAKCRKSKSRTDYNGGSQKRG